MKMIIICLMKMIVPWFLINSTLQIYLYIGLTFYTIVDSSAWVIIHLLWIIIQGGSIYIIHLLGIIYTGWFNIHHSFIRDNLYRVVQYTSFIY